MNSWASQLLDHVTISVSSPRRVHPPFLFVCAPRPHVFATRLAHFTQRTSFSTRRALILTAEDVQIAQHTSANVKSACHMSVCVAQIANGSSPGLDLIVIRKGFYRIWDHVVYPRTFPNLLSLWAFAPHPTLSYFISDVYQQMLPLLVTSRSLSRT